MRPFREGVVELCVRLVKFAVIGYRGLTLWCDLRVC